MSEVAPELYAIDLDETAYNTNRAFEEMVRIAVVNGLASADTIADARAKVEATNGSFDLLGHLAKEGIALDEIEALQQTFGDNEAGREFLHPDAYPLFIALNETGTPYYIHTKGGTGTQIAKLRSAELFEGPFESPYIITDNTCKGEEVASMRTANGLYSVEARTGIGGVKVLVARTAFLAEDKPRGFIGLPEDCAGAFIQRPGNKRATQLGDLPLEVADRVTPMSDLNALTERIYRRVERRAA
jgi:hypothetical protein